MTHFLNWLVKAISYAATAYALTGLIAYGSDPAAVRRYLEDEPSDWP